MQTVESDKQAGDPVDKIWWIKQFDRIGAMGILALVLWYVFSVLIPGAQSTYENSLKRQSDVFTDTLKIERDSFTQTLREQRNDNNQSSKEARESFIQAVKDIKAKQ